MSITAKELAKILNISEASVSIALNGKSGISNKTRKKILETANNLGYDFSKIKTHKKNGKIYFLIFQRNGAVVTDTPFFRKLTNGISDTCKIYNYPLNIQYLLYNEDIKKHLDSIISYDCIGIILLGTEMQKEDFIYFLDINVPIILLDSYYNTSKMDCILINNMDGAYQATEYLINKTHSHPGYLHSSYKINNFEERADGYFKAIRNNGFSINQSIIHSLSPSIEGAYADMNAIIKNNENIAESYFADNDLIAAGALKSFKENGFNIPEDISIIGFDNQIICTYTEPSLTTVNVPTEYMGKMAAKRLISILLEKEFFPVKIEINTSILERNSVI